MNIFHFLKKESNRPVLKIAVLTTVSGLSSAGVLAVINMAAQSEDSDSINISFLLMFFAVVGLFIVSQKFILVEGVVIIEEILDSLRVRLSDKIRRTDLLNIEKIGKAQIYNRLTQETTLISQNSVYLITAAQSAILLMFVFAYIAIISFTSAIVLVVILVIGVFVFMKNNAKIITELDETNKAEIEYFNSLTDVLDGLKEIKLNRKKSNSLFSHYKEVSTILHKFKVSSGYLFSVNMVFSNAFIYIVLGAIVFVFPHLNENFSEGVKSITTAMLFATGPLTSMVSMIPYYEKMNLAVRHIYDLEESLDQQLNNDEVQPIEGENQFLDFKKIDFKDICFEYQNNDAYDNFSVGPIDLTLNSGEIMFLVGGNGCGKTTILKVITTLYNKLQSGNIFVDDVVVDNTNYLDYRELYSAIFYDFHLFDKLYGLENVDPNKVNELLKLMKIDHKTEFKEDRFTKQNLSTGQRKRLALIVTFLENKPIYIFDEWAADQDPLFKDYFYHILLKKLKDEGKTVIAVSHDDRYFDMADRVVKLDYGKIVEIKNKK